MRRADVNSGCDDAQDGDPHGKLLSGDLAGLLTLINPFVLPVLSLFLACSLHRDRWAPVALAAGLFLFVVLGLGVAPSGLGRSGDV